MQTPGVLGIDLGTQSVKVALFRDDQCVASVSRAYAVDAPEPGWAQTPTQQWLAGVTEAVAEIVDQHGRPDAVSFSGQMHGVVLVDDKGAALAPAILWADGRSSQQVEELQKQLSHTDLARLGSLPATGLAAATTRWLAQHEPGLLARARYVVQPKDFIRLALTGEALTDPSDASGTLLYDIAAGDWDAAAVASAGVQLQQLPPISSSGSLAGVIRHGVLAGTPVAVGGADTACVAEGLGLTPGEGFIGLGTGSQLVQILTAPSVDPTLRTHTFATIGAPKAGWYRLGAVQSGGLALDRALSWLGASVDDAHAALAQGVQSSDPFFWPFVAGERTPYLDPSLRAGWSQLSLATDRNAMLRSILEGMAFTIAAANLAMQQAGSHLTSPVPVLGGGSRNRAYLQLLADVLELGLISQSDGDLAVRGAARLAGELIGAEVAAQKATAQAATNVDPRPAPMLRERFMRWQSQGPLAGL